MSETTLKRKQTMNDYIIYGRDDCEFCIKAINLCINNGTSFSFINMTSKDMSKETLSVLLNIPVETVPQVVLGDIYIGGSDALENHFT